MRVFFSDSILEFINDEEDKEEFENIDYLFGQIPDEVFTAVVDSCVIVCIINCMEMEVYD